MSPISRCAPARFVAAAWLALALVPAAQAHDAWIDAEGSGYAVFYGHDDKTEPYVPAKVKSVSARDAQGADVAMQRKDGSDTVTFVAAKSPSLATLTFDNGFWTQPPGDQEMRNVPKRDVPGAVSTLRSLKCGKTVFSWSEAVTRPQGQRLEFVPLSAQAPKAGQTLPVQVLWEGQPLAGAKIVRARFSKERPIATDAQGRAQIPVAEGRQMLTVSHNPKVSGDPQLDSEAIAANLVFTAN